MEKLKINEIVADPNQPRKYFSVDKLNLLKKSIKENGIINPVVVQKKGDKYELLDGERRFRCAQELGLTEVPVLIMKTMSEQEKLIKQFHLQEQHQGWTAIEKANAIKDVANMMEMSFVETAAVLGVSQKNAKIYCAIFGLANKSAFEKSEISIEWATPIVGVVNSAKSAYKQTETEFTKTEAGMLEKAVVKRIKNGEITHASDMTKLKDSFKKNPKCIKTFIEDDSVTPEQLFCQTKAKGAFHLRNAVNHAGYIQANIKSFLSVGDVKLSSDEARAFRAANSAILELLRRGDNE